MPLSRVKPDLSELLPTPELRAAYEEASAALEAGRLRNEAGLLQQAPPEGTSKAATPVRR